ncbi:MAG: hypothetical protein EBZ13_11090, partial [Planctomycetia bacterium]|nr:hypothetical protein [Planctomycetia bacterium]
MSLQQILSFSAATDTVSTLVTPVSATPTLDPLPPLTIAVGSEEQTVSLTGISAGGGQFSPLRVTATSSNPGLIATPTVSYTSPASSGSLAFTPVPDQTGTAEITVTVEAGGLDGDLATVEDNVTVSRSFAVTVMPAAELTLPDLVVAAGAEFSVPIATSDVPGLQSIGLTLNFDASVLEAVSVAAGSLTSGWVVAANTSVAGQVAVSLVNQAPVDGSGTLAVVTFRAIGAGGTSTGLALSRSDLNDGAIPSRVTAGAVSIRQPTLSGAVRYFGNNGPVAGADLTLTPAGGPVQTVTAQANGSYSFTGVASGSQELSVSMSGGTEAISAYDAALVLQHDVGL